MSWLSEWFDSSRVNAIERGAKAFLKTLYVFFRPSLKVSVNELWTIANREVSKAESSDLSGDAKFEMAFKGISSQAGDVAKFFLSTAIELAVAYLNAKLKKM
jgi:hypothetical protein